MKAGPFLLLWIAIVHQSMTWNLPDVKFVSDIARKYNAASIVIFVPNYVSKVKISNHMKEYFSQNVQREFTLAYIEAEVAIDIGFTSTRKREEDVFIYVVDDQAKMASMATFQDLFNLRSRSDKEIWLLDVTSFTDTDESKAMMAGLQADMDDDLFWFAKEELNDIINLWEVYRIVDDFPLEVLPFGNWTLADGLVCPTEEKWQRRRNMKMAHLNVQNMDSIPYTTAMIPITNDTFIMEGMFADVFNSLRDTLNFTYTLKKPPDQNWGALQDDGSWNGMVQQLQMKKADIAPTDFTVTVQRSEVITFAQPITQIHHRLFVKNPTGTYNYKAYTDPLYYKTWLGLLLFCALVPIILYMTSNYGAKDPKYYDFSRVKSYVFILSSLTMRGWSSEPSTAAARIAFLFLMFGCILIYWHWEAMLISYLATRVIVLPFQGIKSLLDQSAFRIALNPGTSYEDAFKLSKDPVWQEAWNTRIKDNLEEYKPYRGVFFPMMETDPEIAIYDNYYSMIAYGEYERCEILATPMKYDFKPYAWGFQKDSPLLGLFNFYLKEMREKGALKKILNKYEAQPQVCPDYSGQPLGMDNCFTAFVMLLGAGVLSIILMGIESISIATGKPLPPYEIMPEEEEPASESESILVKKKNQIILQLMADNKALEAKLARYENYRS